MLAEPKELETTEDGQIPQGSLFLSVSNKGKMPALFNGVKLLSGESKSYPFVGKNYSAFTYHPDGSTLQILYVI